MLVPKVPAGVEIGGNLVEIWCQIGEKKEKAGKCLLYSKINLFCGD